MEKLKSLNATEIRNNFFKVVNDSFLNDKVFLVEKRGVPLVYIVPANDKFIIRKKPKKKVASKS